jgi:hypothetical protein
MDSNTKETIQMIVIALMSLGSLYFFYRLITRED